MGNAIAQFGLQQAQNIIGAGMGMALAGWQDRRQRKQQRKLQEIEIQGQQQMTDYNMMKQMEMWRNTNYGAQMEQLKQAGLNPGLIYGMGGGGGATTNIETGKVGAAQAAGATGEPIAMAAQAAQMALMRAQKENIEADTQKKKVETTKTAGADTKLTETQTESLIQGIENAKAQKELTEVQTSIASIEEHIKGATQNQAIAMAMSELRSATATMKMLERQNDIDEATKQQKIEIVKATLGGMLIENALHEQQITASKEQINAMWTEIAQKWAGLTLQERNTVVSEKLAKVSAGKLKLEQQQTIIRTVEQIFNRLMPNASSVINQIKPAL